MSEKLISAERLKQVLDKNFGHTGGAAVLEQLIDIAPAVDAVEVVLCRECANGSQYDRENYVRIDDTDRFIKEWRRRKKNEVD